MQRVTIRMTIVTSVIALGIILIGREDLPSRALSDMQLANKVGRGCACCINYLHGDAYCTGNSGDPGSEPASQGCQPSGSECPTGPICDDWDDGCGSDADLDHTCCQQDHSYTLHCSATGLSSTAFCPTGFKFCQMEMVSGSTEICHAQYCNTMGGGLNCADCSMDPE